MGANDGLKAFLLVLGRERSKVRSAAERSCTARAGSVNIYFFFIFLND